MYTRGGRQEARQDPSHTDVLSLVSLLSFDVIMATIPEISEAMTVLEEFSNDPEITIQNAINYYPDL